MTTRLIETWLPIAEIGLEGLRERTPMTPFPAPRRLPSGAPTDRL
jgi:putative DNA methylase